MQAKKIFLNKMLAFYFIWSYTICIDKIKRKENSMIKIVYVNDKDFDGASAGIFEQKNGLFLAMTYTKSKEFKTLNGAKKFMAKYGFVK